MRIIGTCSYSVLGTILNMFHIPNLLIFTAIRWGKCIIITPLQRWGCWGAERWSSVSRQHRKNKARIWTPNSLASAPTLLNIVDAISRAVCGCEDTIGWPSAAPGVLGQFWVISVVQVNYEYCPILLSKVMSCLGFDICHVGIKYLYVKY